MCTELCVPGASLHTEEIVMVKRNKIISFMKLIEENDNKERYLIPLERSPPSKLLISIWKNI